MWNGKAFSKRALERSFLRSKKKKLTFSDFVFISDVEVSCDSSVWVWSCYFQNIDSGKKKYACFYWISKTKPNPKNLNSDGKIRIE